jgi:hypothetical protein
MSHPHRESLMLALSAGGTADACLRGGVGKRDAGEAEGAEVTGFFQGGGEFDEMAGEGGDGFEGVHHRAEEGIGDDEDDDDGVGMFGAHGITRLSEHVGREASGGAGFNDHADFVVDGIHQLVSVLFGGEEFFPRPAGLADVADDGLFFVVPITLHRHDTLQTDGCP